MEQVSEPPRSKGSLGFALVLGVTAALFLGFARSETEVPSGEGDPGPWAVPIALSLVIAAGAVLEFWQWLRGVRSGARDEAQPSGVVEGMTASADDGSAALVKAESERAGLRRMIAVALGVAAYLAGLPIIGFSLSTFAFVSLLVWALGSRWWVATSIAVAQIVFVRVLFNNIFQIPLPEGPLESFFS